MPAPTATTAPSTTPRCDATNLFDTTPPTELTAVQIEERLLGHAAQIATLTARFLELLAEFEDRHTWVGDGILSLAHWLSLRAGLSMRTAHDHVRVARALRNLPRIHTAFTHGQLSYSNVRAITRVATPDREPELLNLALSADAAQVELLVRAMRNIDDHRYQKHNRPPQSTASWRWNTDNTLTVSMRLTPLDGAGFLAAIVRAEYERTRTADDPDIAPLTDNHPTTDPDTPPAPGDLSDLHLWRNTPANIAPPSCSWPTPCAQPSTSPSSPPAPKSSSTPTTTHPTPQAPMTATPPILLRQTPLCRILLRHQPIHTCTTDPPSPTPNSPKPTAPAATATSATTDAASSPSGAANAAHPMPR
jgi:hypothetical protein